MKPAFEVPVNVRGSVAYFAAVMELVLAENDHHGGWRDCDLMWLLAKLTEEVGEIGHLMTEAYTAEGVRYAIAENQVLEILRELVDVANVVMMMFDVLSERLTN